jgi:hypothetical protein
MSNVEVHFGDNAQDTATLLLAAAEDLKLEPTVVEVRGTSTFSVPEEVAEKAGLKVTSADEDEQEKSKAPAKKAAAKKSAKNEE